MPQLFNVNKPTSMDAIQQFISGYANPEAAESDLFFNAPNARGYLEKQYGALTGDAFADPFEDAKNARHAAIMQAANSGASVAVGGNTGPKMLTLPDNMFAATNGATPNPLAAPSQLNSTGVPLSRSANRATENALTTEMLQGQGRRYQLAGNDMAIPSPKANDYLQVLEKRANLSGAGDLWRDIYRNDPSIFDSGTASDDPRFARVQGGKEGKIEAADSLHPIANNPKFMETARRNPKKAAALYEAVTNGRDYKTDIDAKSQLLAEQHDTRQKMIASFKGLRADPTGKLFRSGGVDQFGNDKPEIPLSEYETAIVNTNKGTARDSGVQLPNFGGLPALEGMTAEGQKEFGTRTQRIMSERKLPLAQAKAAAQAEMHQEQQKVATLQPSSPSNPLDALMFTQPRDVYAPTINLATRGINALKSPLNVLPRASNALSSMMGSDRRFGTIPDIPMMNSSMSPEEVQGRGSVLELLKQLLAQGQAAY